MNVLDLVSKWPDAHREEFEERAAIIQFDGKQTQQNAEGMAYRQILKGNHELIPQTR